MKNRRKKTEWSLKMAVLVLLAFLSLSCGSQNAYVSQHPELPGAVKEAITEGKVAAGMTKEQVIASAGEPQKRVSWSEAKVELTDPYGKKPTINTTMVMRSKEALNPGENPGRQVWLWYQGESIPGGLRVESEVHSWPMAAHGRFRVSRPRISSGYVTEYFARFEGDSVVQVGWRRVGCLEANSQPKGRRNSCCQVWGLAASWESDIRRLGTVPQKEIQHVCKRQRQSAYRP